MRFWERPRKTKLRYIILAGVFLITSSFGNLIVFVAETYAAALTNVSYYKVADVKDCPLIQGSATDGKYVYSACVNGDDHSATEIVKSDLSGKEYTRSKEYSRDTVGHANAMAYNSKMERLFLTAWDDSSSGNNGITNKVRVINPSSLGTIESTKTFNKGEVPNICYNASRDQYVANGRLFDSSYRYVRTIFDTGDSKFNADSQMTGATSGQGIACDDSNIYVIRWSKEKSITRIISYNWSGSVTAIYNLKDMKDEVESLFIAGNTMYAGVNNFSGSSSYIIKIAGVALGSVNTVSLTVGTYNILGYYHGEGSRYDPARLKQIVSNINTMKYDVVGLQEYRNQASGNAKELEDQLKSLNASWTMSYSDKTMGSGFDDDQLNIVYNSSTVRLVEDTTIRAIDSRNSACDAGGTGAARIARFATIASGQEFLFINVHPTPNHDSSKCDKERLDVVKGVLADKTVASYTGPLFFVGDFNANPTGDRGNEKNVDAYLKSVGYGNARDIPGAIRKAGGVIDHVYYKISSISAPTSYEAMACEHIPEGDPTKYKASMTCASDHYPVKATFGGGINQAGCHDPNDAQFSDWNINLYDPTCVSACSENTVGSMSGDTNFKKIATYLASKGLNAIAISGILGNWDVESPGLSAFRQEGGQSWPSGGYGFAQWTGGRRTNGTSTGVADILQKDPRTKDSFAEYYSAKYGGPPPDGGIPEGVPSDVNDAWIQVELDFMLEEFNQKQYNIGGGYTDVLVTAVSVNKGDDLKTALNSAQSATDAALIFTALFEKQGALKAIHDAVGSESDAKIKERFLASVARRTSQAEKDILEVQALVGSGVATTSATGALCANSSTSGVAIDGMMFPLQGVKKDLVGNGGGGKGSHLGGGTCPNYWAYDLMMTSSAEAKAAASTVKVVAITDGTISDKVTIKSYSLGGQPYGWQLGLETSDGSLFYYTHMLSKPVVRVGQAVKVGDLLEVGVKDVNGEHLHIDESPKGKGRNGPFQGGLSRSTCSRAQAGDFVELGPALKKLWEAME